MTTIWNDDVLAAEKDSK